MRLDIHDMTELGALRSALHNHVEAMQRLLDAAETSAASGIGADTLAGYSIRLRAAKQILRRVDELGPTQVKRD